MPDLPRLRGPGGRRLRLAHLTTVDMSLALLLGAELQADVASGLDTLGISAAGAYVAQVEALGVRHVAVPGFTRSWGLLEDLRAAGELRRLIRGLQLDILHTHTPKAGVLGRAIGRSLRIPVVVNTCHGLWVRPGQRPAVRWAVLGVEGAAGLLSDAELYQNAEDRAALRWVVPARRSRVVGNGVDLTRFRVDPEARRRVRAEWGVAEGEVLVGGVGRRVAEKGIGDFVLAAAAMDDPHVRYVWVGPADPEKPDDWRREDGPVTFVGERSDMPAVYAAFDVFVLPSYREGFSRSAMEAAASGVAMVLTDIRGCREIGHDGRHLRLVPAGAPARLRATLEELVADPQLRLRLGEAAQTRARAEFDQLAVAATSLDTYAAVARRKRLGWELG